MSTGRVIGKVRLYVHPASIQRTRYPYLMFNMVQWKRAFCNSWFEHAIMDAGVETWFFKQRLTDYPPEFLSRYPGNARELSRRFGKRIWVTIPDYPDDYEQGLVGDNVKKTFRNIERFHKIEGVNWLYPLQAHYLDKEGFVKSCERLRKYKPERIGIGTVCKTRNTRFITFCCKVAREYFPDAWIHAFGATLKALPYIKYYIDSMDSSAWAYQTRFGKCGLEAFYEWLEKFNRIISRPSLYDFVI